MRSGVFFAQSHQPDKAVVNFDVLMLLTVYDRPFSNLNVIDQFLHDVPVEILQVQILPDSSGPPLDIGDVLLRFSLPSQQRVQAFCLLDTFLLILFNQEREGGFTDCPADLILIELASS